MSKTATTDGGPVGVITAGQVVSYNFAVTNTGNVTLSDIAIADGPFTGTGALPTPICPQPELAPGASQICTSTYTVTQEDVDSDDLTNTATASGTPPGGGAPATSGESSVVLHSTPRPAMTLQKVAHQSTVNKVGDLIDYTFTVTNTGNVTLHDVGVTDVPTAPAGPSSAPVCQSLSTPAGTCSGSTTTLGLGQSATFTASYRLTQADLDHGSVSDTATAGGLAPGDAPVVADSSAVTVPVTQSPALSVVKKSDVSTVSAAGQTIGYTFTVTNTGNVTLHSVTVIDTPVAPTGKLTSGPDCPQAAASSLAPHQTVVCTGTYVATDADLTSGIDHRHRVSKGADAGKPRCGVFGLQVGNNDGRRASDARPARDTHLTS